MRRTLDERVKVKNYIEEGFSENLTDDVVRGLTARPQKCIPSKYLYDSRGSRLFEEICAAPEYYPTRTEMSILKERAGELVAPVSGPGGGDLVELGSGANWKVRILLEALGPGAVGRIKYVPVDVSESALREAASGLVEAFTELRVVCLVADFTRHLDELMTHVEGGGPRLFLFLGSTIGNFTEDEADGFLRNIASAMGENDRALVGLDMVKPREVLEAAYNDSGGVTAEFNLNILNVVRRELGVGLDPADFSHRAFFNERESRVEMHLAAERDVEAELPDGGRVEISRGETIRTEICRKFTREGAEGMFARAGLAPERWFTDDSGWFSLVELARA